ncbi:MAG TPA: DUF1508 domain-containing protein [Verrucomicrobiae bacterium]
MMKYEYWQSAKDHRWYWQLKADGGERLAYGESHATKEACLKSIQMAKNSLQAVEIDVTVSDSSQQNLFKPAPPER